MIIVMNATTAINAYNKVGLESSVFGADPHALISMLYRGAMLEVSRAKNEISRNETAAKCKSISKAIAIIDEGLDACLDKDVGGELAQSLSSLYKYMIIRLVHANLKNDIATLDEVAGLLSELQGAWESISPRVKQVALQPGMSTNTQRARATA